MLAVDEALSAALKTHQEGSAYGVARYQGTQTLVRVATTGNVTYNGNGQIQTAAQVTAFGVGGSLVPEALTDPLATYGQEMALWRTVRIRDDIWDIPLGVFRITNASSAVQRFRSDTVLDWSLSLDLKDRFEAVIADDFVAVDGPLAGNTVWDEFRRLSPFPVIEALGDTGVPAATVYKTRYEALVTLADILGGVPHVTREGALTVRLADAWLTETDPVFDIEGTITYSADMSNNFFNQVQVSNPNDPQIVAFKAITDSSNPLSVERAGGRTYKQASTIYETPAAAAEAAETLLARVSTKRSRTVIVDCTPEALLLELGDVGWVRDPVQNRAAFGEVSGLTIPLDPTAPVRVELIAAVTE